MKSNDTTQEILNLLTADSDVKQVYDRQKSIIKIAELIKALRKSAQLTQSELGNLIGSNQTVISRMESYDSDNMPNLETLILIFHACGRELNLNANTSIPNSVSADSVVSQTVIERVQVAF